MSPSSEVAGEGAVAAAWTNKLLWVWRGTRGCSIALLLWRGLVGRFGDIKYLINVFMKRINQRQPDSIHLLGHISGTDIGNVHLHLVI